MKRKMMRGLDKVTKKAVVKLCSNVPLLPDEGLIHFRGSVRNMYMPNMKSMTLPTSLSQKMFCSLSIKSITTDMPKPVMSAYMMSLSAAPAPVTIPYALPFCIVR